jgi:hypothetical protein
MQGKELKERRRHNGKRILRRETLSVEISDRRLHGYKIHCGIEAPKAQ